HPAEDPQRLVETLARSQSAEAPDPAGLLRPRGAGAFVDHPVADAADPDLGAELGADVLCLRLGRHDEERHLGHALRGAAVVLPHVRAEGVRSGEVVLMEHVQAMRERRTGVEQLEHAARGLRDDERLARLVLPGAHELLEPCGVPWRVVRIAPGLAFAAAVPEVPALRAGRSVETTCHVAEAVPSEVPLLADTIDGSHHGAFAAAVPPGVEVAHQVRHALPEQGVALHETVALLPHADAASSTVEV